MVMLFLPMAMLSTQGVAASSVALVVEEESVALVGRVGAFLGLFTLSALLHAAEVAITTLYPWKVKEFAEEEGPRSSFAMLDVDITRALTSILVATTCANVCSTALFADCATTFWGPGETKALAIATAVLTAATLFFGELLPKAIGVNNAEMVARACLPAVNAMTLVLGPVGSVLSKSARTLLRRVFRIDLSAVENAVSEEELRLIVGGATESGGIESLEGTMIEGVLDLQDTRVAEIMRPRVEVDALEGNESMRTLLELVNATGHSRIPVYEDEIDNIVGVVNAKKLLDVVKQNTSFTDVVKDHAEPTYFVPETMVAWKVLEEMRRRRLHMAIVVDEFGGTAGMVTLEDILELVVGDIYDEDDREDLDEKDEILFDDDDQSYAIPGTAPVDTLIDTLAIPKDEFDVNALPDVTTAAGFVCYFAGEIPAVGDHVFVANYDFEVTDADERRVFLVKARNLELMDLTTPLWKQAALKAGRPLFPPEKPTLIPRPANWTAPIATEPVHPSSSRPPLKYTRSST